MPAGVVMLFLCGDVMLGRGVDQILRHPGDPTLQEAAVRDAREYVELAEAVNGPIPRPVDAAWPWGDALPLLDDAAPDVRVVNLETSVTTSGRFAPGKAVHYRMSPANVAALSVVRPDVCVLANNHVLDFGTAGLLETLDVLAGENLPAAGAGRDVQEAERPAAVPLAGGGRVLVLARALPSSGVPWSWAATDDRPGVALLPEPSPAEADRLIDQVQEVRQPGDVVVVSIHWGPNWGYEVSDEEVRFAHRLVDGGVDVVHGHSSHHPRPLEVYRDRLILYGCGDFVDDYEGIGGYERYRDDLRLLYLVSLTAGTGELVELRMVPLQAVRMRLQRAADQDSRWLHQVLSRVSARFATTIDREPDGALAVRRA